MKSVGHQSEWKAVGSAEPSTVQRRKSGMKAARARDHSQSREGHTMVPAPANVLVGGVGVEVEG
jgi:hypothetical protein